MSKVLAAAVALALALSACAPSAPNARPGSISASGRGTAVPGGAATPANEVDKNNPQRGSAGLAVH
jgi:hypothetical protein